MTNENQPNQTDKSSNRTAHDATGLNRRRFLEAVSVGAAGTVLLTGGASAHQDAYTEADDQPGTDKRVDALVAAMTLDEKITKVHNHAYLLPTFATGYVAPTPRLSIPDMQLADGPVGVRHPLFGDEPNLRDPENFGIADIASGGPSTAFPASISQVATWDHNLMRAFGVALGKEGKAKDQNGLFAPAFNIARVPECGRNFEYFGEDPYLAGRAAVAVIEGIQSTGTIATAKHFVANNQEDSRRTVSADVGERALREIYLPAFRAAVEEANVGSVMAAYNRVNGTYCTENARLLIEILKDEWGFDGYVISDYGATHSTVPAATAGLDFEAPARDTQFFGAPLKRAVQNGTVSEATLNNKVRRILGQKAKFGVLDGERVGPPGEANTDAHQQLARRIAADGAVLLKNEIPMKADSVSEEPVLPLDLTEVDIIAVVGPRANEAKTGGGGSSNVTPPPGSSVSPVEGIRERAGSRAAVTTATGDATADAVALAAASDVAVVVATGSSLEGTDREDLVLNNDQNELIFEVAAANPQTIVVLRTGGPVVMPWLDVVSAVLETWYPGMKDGAATADLLFGDVNPSGRLPITFGKCRADYPATEEVQYPGVDESEGYPVAEYSEGVFVGYRHFDAEGTEPLFEFGYGLSYTNFKYSNIEVTPMVQPNADRVSVQVSLTIENVGDRVGKEVVQVYVVDESASVDRPPKELKAFEKTTLEPNETTKITFQLGRDAFSFYDVETGDWIVESGVFEILVGSSSRDVRQREAVSIVDPDK